VFANVLNNAAKFTPEQGRIGIAVARDGGEVAITIKDDGIGIPSEQLANVFEMFAQVAGEGQRGQDGLGIGLSLVRRLVALHGGSVALSSAGLGSGTEVTVRLPVLATGDAAPGAVEVPAALVPQRPRRVLVADDNADHAETLSAMLRLMSCDVVVAHDGLEAIDLAESFRPEIALLDIGMPALDGNAAARRIRGERWGAGITLIALSGWGQPGDRRKTSAAGFDHHLIKPVDVAVLRRMIEATTPLGLQAAAT
jgi:CheY-like chemotaxis protein